MRFGTTLGSASQDRATWLALVALLVGVLAPAATVIWFMNEAMANQADASRQRVSEAYRGQLRLLRDRIDADWRARASELADAPAGGPTAFQRIVQAGRADSIVFFRNDGSPEYPSPAATRAADPRADHPAWRSAQMLESAGRHEAAASAYAQLATQERDPSLAARAAQGHVRSLVQGGDTAGALRAIERYFSSGAMASGRDRQGRLIAADANLLALRLMTPADARRAVVAARLLASRLNDYQHTTMPSAQRLFLMGELLDAAPSTNLPTYEAERLAAEFLQADGARAAGPVLESTASRGIWKIGVRNSAVALFKTDTVVAAAQRILGQQNTAAGARFAMRPPGTPGVDEAIAASSLLPGWQLSFTLLDADRIEEGSRQRTTIYVWSGAAAIAVLAVAGLLLWQSFRRQMRLTRLKTDLVAAVSHELKTPLASMRLLVDSLLDDDELDRVKTRDYLRMMAGENARLSRLIEHFLTFSRIEHNRQRLTFAHVQPSAVVGSAVGLVRERFDASGTHLEVAVAPDLPPLQGDEDALVTVLLNLLENAYTYTGDEKRIALHAYRDADRIVFEVKDNGIGIAPRDQRRVFRRFYQVDQRLSREHSGCGLGLSIVDFIVRAHGGAVALTSQVGVGSCFRVSLPCRRTGQEAAA